MSDFKIKVNVELDAKDLESQLKNLGEQEIKVKLNGIDKIEEQLKSLKNSFRDAFKVDGSFAKDLNKIAKAIEKLNGGGGGTNKPSSSASKLVSEYKDLANTVEKLQKQLNKGLLNDDSIARSNSLIEKLKEQMNSLKGEMNKVELASIEAFEGKLENKHFAEMNNYLNKIETTATSLGTKLKSISFDHIDTSKIEEIENKLKEIQDIAKQDIDLEDMVKVGGILSDLDRISNEIKNLEKVENLASSFEKISSSVADTSGDIEKLSSEIKSLENVADNLDGSFDRAFKGANNGVKDFQSNLKKLNSSSKSGSGIFGDKDDFLGNFTQFKILDLAGEFIADGVRKLASAWKDTIVETDTAITDLNKVLTNRLTGDALDGYLNQVTQVAKGTGQASTDIIQGTAKAVQSGIKDTEQALKYAQQSAIFANIGDMSQEEADKILTSVMSANGGVEKSLQQTSSHLKAYGKDYSQLQEFIDMANFAGNNFAVTTKDVGTALQLSSSALSANGVSMEKQIAMSVAMNEVMQDASKTGNSLKSISANMSGVVFSLKEGDVQANKSAKALEKLTGIKLFDETTGEVMDMYDAMDKLSGKWDDLTEAEKSTIAQTIAGKQQLTSFFALMDNWETAQQYVADYNDGLKMAGSATRENEQYLDSIQGKWNSIKEDLKATGLNIIDSEMAKDGLDVISSITSVLPKASEKANEFYKAFYGGNFDGEVSDFIYESFEKIDLSGKLKGLSSQISSFFSNTFNKDNKFVKAISGMFDSLSKNDFISKGLTDLSTAYGKYIDAITNFGGAGFFKGLGKVLNTEEKQLQSSIDGHNDRISTLNSEISVMKSQQEAIAQVSDRYDELSKMTKRSKKQEEEYANLKNQIAQQSPDMVLGYEDDGTPILKNLKLQNQQYERQIKLKQQSLRLEENALANDTQKQRLQDLEEYNETLEKYNNMDLYSSSKRKEGFFTNESLQDYAKRIQENNAEIEKENQESYNKRLEDHQKYIADEMAIQEKYINQMESSSSFGKLTDDAKSNMLSFMDTLNWSEFSDSQASAFTRQLEKVSDKIVSTTDQMGDYGKKINEISDAYANNEMNMINYTKALGEQYELAGKLDNQSLSEWYSSLQDYASLTGDLTGANACINEMASSLEKITGIKADSWKTAFQFDPAPIDASNKALQNFLKSYNTGVQNLGKGGLADTLKTQFEALQDGYLQLTNDIANLGVETIDKEYLLNLKINQPKPIQTLIDEILADSNISEEEIELLLTVMPEILNTGEISDATLEQIAEVLDMDVQEVKAKFKINAEVDGDLSGVEEYIQQWDGITDEEKQLLLKMLLEDSGDIESAIGKWESLSDEEKQQVLKQVLEGESDFSTAIEKFESVQEGEKEQTLKQKAEGKEELQAGKYTWEEITSGDKNNNLNFKTNGKGELESGKSTWDGIKSEDKEQTLKQKAEGKEEVKSASDSLEKLPSKKEVVVEIVQSGKNLLDSIANWFDSKSQKQTVEVTATVTGEDAVNRLKTNLSNLQSKSVSVSANVSGADLVNTLKTNISGIQGKSVAVRATVSGTNEVNALKTAISGLNGKSVAVRATVSGTDLVRQLKNAIDTVQNKSVTVTATVNGTSEVKALKSAIDTVKSKSVTVSATTSGTKSVNSLAEAIAAVQSKTVTVTVNKVTTTTNKPSSGGSSGGSTGERSINTTPSTVITNLSSIPIMASDTSTESTPSLANTTISASAVNRSTALSSVEYGVAPYIELEQALERITSQLDLLDKKAEDTFGTKKIGYLNQQVSLLKQQQNLQKQISSEEQSQLSVLKSQLQSKGFIINANNEILNYEEKLLSMEKNVDSLNDAYERASKLARDTDSKNESLKSSREKQAENAKEKYDSANESLSLTKKYLDEFIDSSKELNDANETWQECANEIKKINNEIEELNRELRLFTSSNNLIQLNYEFEKVGNSLDILDNKMDDATDTEKIDLLTQSISLLNQQLNLQSSIIESTKQQMKAYQTDLSKYGFKFNSNNEITNFSSNMERFKNSDDLEKIVELTDEYFDLQKDLGKLTVEYDDLKDSISDAKTEIKEINEELEKERLEGLKEQLEATEEIEKEITKIYEKEYEKRKDEIEDYMDKRIQMLEDEKDAYKEMRDEQEYEKELQDYTDEVEELRKKLEVAKRDSSIQGLKRQKELAEELTEAEEKLAKYTQDKIDEDYEKNIDREIEKIEEEKDALLGALEEQFSEVNIAKMVQSALTSGFVEINGEITSIQDLLMESINNTAEGYSVMGATIKKELVDNLNIALETMNELNSIYKDLDLANYGMITSNIPSSIPTSNYSTNTRSINVGETNITINGSVSDDILDDIEDLIEQKNNELLKSLSKNL